MAQISRMAHLMVISCTRLLKIAKCLCQHLCHILIDNLTMVHRDNIIKASPLMHTKGKWSILIGVSKGELHFIAIGKLSRAVVHPFKKCIKLVLS